MLNTENNILNDITENYKHIMDNIAQAAIQSKRNPEDIELVAVTKTVPVEYIRHAIDLGVRIIGENRVQELISKQQVLDMKACQSHLIGHLQSNKVQKIVGQADMIQSVDSLHIAKKIDFYSSQTNTVTNILIQVNIGNETQKSGVLPEDLEELIHQILVFSRIKVKGLMAIPPACDSEEEAKPYFDSMYTLFNKMSERKWGNDSVNFQYLSMGMSADYQTAITCGANLVRVGTALFGSRN